MFGRAAQCLFALSSLSSLALSLTFFHCPPTLFLSHFLSSLSPQSVGVFLTVQFSSSRTENLQSKRTNCVQQLPAMLLDAPVVLNLLLVFFFFFSALCCPGETRTFALRCEFARA